MYMYFVMKEKVDRTLIVLETLTNKLYNYVWYAYLHITSVTIYYIKKLHN